MTPNISRREFFAAQAMAALIAKIPLHDRQGEHGLLAPEVEDIHQVRKDVAQSAFDYADAMEELAGVPCGTPSCSEPLSNARARSLVLSTLSGFVPADSPAAIQGMKDAEEDFTASKEWAKRRPIPEAYKADIGAAIAWKVCYDRHYASLLNRQIADIAQCQASSFFPEHEEERPANRSEEQWEPADGERVYIGDLKKYDDFSTANFNHKRKPNVFGVIASYVPGLGGDVWFVKLDDGTETVYLATEMKPAAEHERDEKKQARGPNDPSVLTTTNPMDDGPCIVGEEADNPLDERPEHNGLDDTPPGYPTAR